MRVLLDTHVVMWFMLNDPKLSMPARNLLIDPANVCHASPANHWQMAIKLSVGRFRIKRDFEAMWQEAIDRFGVLPIELRHSARLISLPFHHKDPFDRMLVAQALVEQIPLVSSDVTLDVYGVQRVW